MKKNALYAQSGGVTAVINATAGALILEARKNKNIGKDSLRFSVVRLDLSNIAGDIFDFRTTGRKSCKKKKNNV